MNPRAIRTFRDLRASMTPVMWLRAIVVVIVLAVYALIGLAAVLALVLWLILTAIHGFERFNSTVLIAVWQWHIAHSLI